MGYNISYIIYITKRYTISRQSGEGGENGTNKNAVPALWARMDTAQGGSNQMSALPEKTGGEKMIEKILITGFCLFCVSISLISLWGMLYLGRPLIQEWAYRIGVKIHNWNYRRKCR